MDPLDIKAATDEITTKTLPELLAGLNQLLERLEALAERLDGASLVLVLAKKQ